MFDSILDNYKAEIVKETCNLINIPSFLEASTNPMMPFGKNANSALEYALNLGNKLGFRTKNIDGYCGYIEFGEGEKLVGIVGHLDVVPSGDGWNSDPFCAQIRDNKIYGRGAIDDKGPVVASLYAMKAIKDNAKINSRVRLILGINEENSWGCINHYKEKEEWPTIGFSPDADFPCIYAEKGICTMYIKEDYSTFDSPIIITNIDCHDNAINVVPKFCEVTLKVDTSKISIQDITSFIDNSSSEISFNVDGDSVILTSLGIQAHAAHPDLGKNAISPMILLLKNLFCHFDINIKLFDFFAKFFDLQFDGQNLGINFSDESGSLTLNVGDFKLSNNCLEFGINLRIPVNTPIQTVCNIISDKCKSFSLKSVVTQSQDPLYVSKNDFLVKTLCGIFKQKTNLDLEPIAIGGGTYARAFNNMVYFGANFPDDVDMCHQANEFVYIDKLILASKIYADAIFELAK